MKYVIAAEAPNASAYYLTRDYTWAGFARIGEARKFENKEFAEQLADSLQKKSNRTITVHSVRS